MKERFCEDCRWAVGQGGLAECHAPHNRQPGFKDRYKITYCTSERMGGWLITFLMGECGETGRYFQPREPK